MTDLETIRELRAMGAVHVQIGAITVQFLPTEGVPTKPSPSTPAVSREDQYVLDAVRGAS